jgi:hypothetical protein
VLVVGGGMAGCFAAMAAAERGCRVAIVEPSNVLGGQGTAGGVAGFCGDTARVNHRFDELVAKLAQYDLIQPCNPLADRRDYDLEWFAYFLQEMLLARGVTPLLHSRVIDARADAGRITRVTLTTAGQMLTLEPRFVIDASGLCILPQRAGFAVQHDGALKQLPMSLYFTMWDTGKPVTPILPPGVPTWTNDEDIPMTSLHLFPSGKVEVKMKVVGFDAADGLSLSQAEIFARRHMVGLVHYLQTHGYRGVKLDRHVLAGVSRQIGVREQNRLVGEHILTEHEMSHGCIFDDALAVGTYHYDYHWPDRMQRAGTGICTMVEPYHIPLRCMVPRGSTNLLVPGRGASAEQMAMSAFRVMTIVAQMGYGAGTAAAHALRTNKPILEVEMPAVQRDLATVGHSLDLSDYGEYLRNIILTDERVAELPRPASRVALERMSNGRFVAVVQTDAGELRYLRSQGQWQATTGSEPASSPRMATRGGGGQVRIDAQTGLRLELDSPPASLELVKGPSPVPAALADTCRGVAVAYVDERRTLRFWHGSPERLLRQPGREPAS